MFEGMKDFPTNYRGGRRHAMNDSANRAQADALTSSPSSNSCGQA